MSELKGDEICGAIVAFVIASLFVGFIGTIVVINGPEDPHGGKTLLYYTLNVMLILSTIFLTVVTFPKIFYYFKKLFSKSFTNSTANTIIALLSDSNSWTGIENGFKHSTGIILFYDKNYVGVKGLFNCTFNRKESERILHSIDIMRSSKLTNNISSIIMNEIKEENVISKHIMVKE